jgi:23S rRNA (cytidine1920-2'-O)/16S rRNA (cytidine1409-2'-O)-methyltransferase
MCFFIFGTFAKVESMKFRADVLLAKKGIVKSRTLASELIKAGKVSSAGKKILKPSEELLETAEFEILEKPRYVGRGGMKLEHALREFGVSLKEKTVLDIGSSTGGFSDCAIQHGAKKVIAVDVGTDQFDSELKEDLRIELHEQTDIRDFELKEKVDVAVADVSFISLEQIIPHLSNFLTPLGEAVLLVKPQFEVGKEKVGKGGLVKDDGARAGSLKKVKGELQKYGFEVKAETTSPLRGGDGNIEYLLYAVRT